MFSYSERIIIWKQYSLNNFIAEQKIQDIVQFRTIAYDDRQFHPYQTHTITARLPGDRMCSTKLGIIDDECKFLIIFMYAHYKKFIGLCTWYK